jgi:hypothetical protein
MNNARLNQGFEIYLIKMRAAASVKWTISDRLAHPGTVSGRRAARKSIALTWRANPPTGGGARLCPKDQPQRVHKWGNIQTGFQLRRPSAFPASVNGDRTPCLKVGRLLRIAIPAAIVCAAAGLADTAALRLSWGRAWRGFRPRDSQELTVLSSVRG